MNKRLSLFITLIVLSTSFAKAAPGDTTWVGAHNCQLGWYGNYDTTVSFPHGGHYRRIYMIFTLGKYMCGGSGYCGDWDYTVQNYLIKSTSEVYELGRLITPYANAGAPRTPWTWTQRYVYDVTDYSGKLQDSCKLRILYSGYSGGFTANIKFAMIEGTPDRNVVDIKRLWGGSWAYGDTSRHDSNNINNHLAQVALTAPSGTATADMKFTITGHGSDHNYCSEFCSSNYKVMVNGTSVGTQNIWRTDCPMNQLYPQSGTWLYPRANWCPGSIVYSKYNVLTGVTAGAAFNTAVVIDSYVSSGGASYTIEGTLIYHGPMNKALDITLEDVIAPTNDENHFRENPICGKPVIHVKNTGATTVTTLDVNYGIAGRSAVGMYTWTGSLPSLAETDITLPELPDLAAVAGGSTTLTFYADVAAANGTFDNDSTNNRMTTQFMPAPKYPSTFKILFRTNNEQASAGSRTSETGWIIYDMHDAVVTSHTNADTSSYYVDTVSLGPGCYKLVVYDSSCDGLYWWANPSTITAGSFSVKKLNFSALPLHGFPSTGSYNSDFGCGYVAYFFTDWPAGVQDAPLNAKSMEVFPNPAKNFLNVEIEGDNDISGTILIMDAMGRIVAEQPCNGSHTQVNTAAFANGFYTVQYIDQKTNSKLVSRFVVAK